MTGIHGSQGNNNILSSFRIGSNPSNHNRNVLYSTSSTSSLLSSNAGSEATMVSSDSSYSPTTTSTSSPPQQNTNPVSQLAGFVKDSIVRVKNGTAQLYTNHKICNAIRSKQKQYILDYPSSSSTGHYQKRGISYEEYDFLGNGKLDRNRVGNLVFMMFMSPNFLPYAFMFFPNMLPSTLQGASPLDFNRWEEISRQRAHAVVKTLMELETEARGPVKTNPLIPFGRGKAVKQKEFMGVVSRMAGQLLLLGSPGYSSGNTKASSGIFSAGGADNNNNNNKNCDQATHILNTLQNEFFTHDEPGRNRTSLSIVPKTIVKGVANALSANDVTAKGSSAGGLLSSFTPHFFTRSKVVTHLTKVGEADEFLVNEGIDLNTIQGDLLIDACNERLIGTPSSSETALRTGLSKWLELTVIRPNQMRVVESEDEAANGKRNNNRNNRDVFKVAMPSGEDGTTTLQPSSVNEQQSYHYYNGYMAKLALMCSNAIDGTRAVGCASALPKLLFLDR